MINSDENNVTIDKCLGMDVPNSIIELHPIKRARWAVIQTTNKQTK